MKRNEFEPGDRVLTADGTGFVIRTYPNKDVAVLVDSTDGDRTGLYRSTEVKNIDHPR